jgi:hypothetical protein
MLHKISVLMLLAGFAAMNVAAQRRDLNADRQAIIALDELWLNAYDASTLDRILANDFRHPVVTGQFLTKQQHIDWMVAHPPPPTPKSTVRADGRTAVRRRCHRGWRCRNRRGHACSAAHDLHRRVRSTEQSMAGYQRSGE